MSGQPEIDTYAELVSRLVERRAAIGQRVAFALDQLRGVGGAPFDDGSETFERRQARCAYSAVDSEWRQVNGWVRKWEAFIAVHPEMASQAMTTKCAHRMIGAWPACYVGVDDGWYRTPVTAAPDLGAPVPPKERVVGEDDGDETPFAEERRTG